MSYDRKNILGLSRELGITAPQLYKCRKECAEFVAGRFPEKGNLKRTPEQENINELEKRLKDAKLERGIL